MTPRSLRSMSPTMQAALLVCGATLCFAILDSMVKHLSARYPVSLLVWARWGLQMLILLAWLGPRMKWGLVKTGNLTSQLFRGAILLGSSLCFVAALRVMPLAEATALNYSTPTLVTIMAVVLLDEKMTPVRVGFVVAGFLGMLLIVRPGSEMFQGAALFALGAAWFYAMFQIVTRKLANEDWETMLFYPAMFATVATSWVLPFVDWPEKVEWLDVVMLIACGALGTFGHFLFLRAFQRAPASAVTPFTYMQLVWATLIGWAVFGAFPGGLTLLGMTIIAGSGLFITLHEHRKARTPPVPEPTAVD